VLRIESTTTFNENTNGTGTPIGQTPVLRLEGTLTAPAGLDELKRICQPLLDEHSGLVLDLSGITFVDRAAASSLAQLQRRGVVLRGCSPLIQELLKEIDR
jgi:anti-anti-sigma regulatory factor